MSDKLFIDEYMNIKAPDELYERILNAGNVRKKKNNIVVFRRIAASAAAIAIIAVTSFTLLSGHNDPQIFVGAEQLTGEVVLTQAHSDGIMLARADDVLECELRLKIRKETFISLSEGFLVDENGAVLIEDKEEKSFSDEIFVKWTIPMADTDKEYILTLRDKKSEYCVKLYFDRYDGNWAVSLTE